MNVMQSKVLADGLIVTAKDSRVLGDSIRLSIPKKIRIDPIEPRQLNGLNLKKCSLKQIPLPNGKYEKLSILIVSPNQQQHIDTKFVKMCYAEALDYVFYSKILGSNKTVDDTGVSMPCHSFVKVNVKNIYCTTCCNGDVLVHESQTVDLINRLLEKLKLTMREKGKENYDCYLLITLLGQHSEWTVFKKNVSWIEPQYADKIIVHVARDYSMDQKCLLWNLEALNEQNHVGKGPKEEMQVFHSLMTLAHANVVFDLTKGRNYNAEAPQHVAKVQFYTDAFKQVHRSFGTGIKKWKSPIVEHALTHVKPCLGIVEDSDSEDLDESDGDWMERERREKKSSSLLHTLMENVCVIERLRNSIRDRISNTARYEAVIVRVNNNGLFGTDIWDMFLIDFDNILGAPNREQAWLGVFDYQRMLDQIELGLMPAINTIKESAKRCLQKRSKGKILDSIPNASTIQNAVVSECIVSFFVFGQLRYHRGGEWHDNRLCKTLNLLKGCYRNLPENGGDPFQGLSLCGDQLQMVEIVSRGTVMRKLQWNGATLHVNKVLPNSLAITTGEFTDLHNCLMIVYEARANGELEEAMSTQNGLLEWICSLFWRAVSEGTSKLLGVEDPTAKDVIQYLKEDLFKPYTFETSEKFIRKLFQSPEDFERVGLPYYAREFEIQLEGYAMFFKKKLTEYFEEQIFKSRALSVLFPVKNDHVFVILPFFGTAENDYEHSSQDKQNLIHELYKVAMEYLWEEPVPPSELRDLILNRILIEAGPQYREKFEEETCVIVEENAGVGELLNMVEEALCVHYGLLYDYNNGSYQH